MTTETCAYCLGTGRDPNSGFITGYKPCPVCDAHSERYVDVPANQLKTCAYCYGTGRDPNSGFILGYVPCPTCGGWGQIEKSGVSASKEKKEPHKSSVNYESESSNRIFIVHGRDKAPAFELARLLESEFKLVPILLQEQPHSGRTIIEKLDDYSNVGYAFVIVTPDDIGGLRGEELKERPRQNVVLEWGHFRAKIGKNKTCILLKGNMDLPSDMAGVGFHRFNDSVEEVFLKVKRELKDAGLID